MGFDMVEVTRPLEGSINLVELKLTTMLFTNICSKWMW